MNCLKSLQTLTIAVSLSLPSIIVGQEEDAAAASATGSSAAPSKGAPKSAQANHQLRTLHIAFHKLGLTHAEIMALGGMESLHSAYKEHGYSNFKQHGDLLAKGHSLEDAILYGEFLREHGDKSLEDALAAAKSAHSEKYADPSIMLTHAQESVVANYLPGYEYNDALESALSVAASLLQDKTITSTLPAVTVTVGKLDEGYNLELLRLLSAYGAIGANGESLASSALSSYSDAEGKYAEGGNLSDLIENSSADYLGFLSTLTGSRAFSSDDATSSLFDVSLDKITLVPSSKLTIGAAETTSTIDVSNELNPAISTSDRKVLVLGAAKDLTIAGDVIFSNPNDAEDHALVLGAADDFYLRTEISPGNPDYATPDPISIEYEGSNLALGSESSMDLISVDIKTGGNLAIGTLDTLKISQSSSFEVGRANSASSDPDNIYLYANEIINIDGLAFKGRIDDIYMESKTIHIKNTTFPEYSEVMLRSQTGALNINNSVAPTVAGAVNFHNVTHLGISDSVLVREDFDGADGHINSKGLGLPNGTPFIRVRAQ